MADIREGWAERQARQAHERLVALRERAVVGDRATLETIDARLEDVVELGLFREQRREASSAYEMQIMRAAVNDLQNTLLTADPEADVHDLALARLLSAAQADRVGVFINRTSGGEVEQELHAEAFVAPEYRMAGSACAEPQAYDQFLPGLLERLAAGEPFSSRTEFLPRDAGIRRASQGAEALLLLPLFVDRLFYGYLRLDRCDSALLWDEEETSILVSAAASVSAAIERQRIFMQLVRRSHELAALLASSRSITSSIDYDVVLREVACAAAGALDCAQAVIWEYSGRGDRAVYRMVHERDRKPGVADRLVGRTSFASDYPGGMRAIREGVIVQRRISDADLSPAESERMAASGQTAWMGVPLVYGEDVLGMMILAETDQDRRFSPDEVRMARMIGEQAASALHNARLHRSEEEQRRWLTALAEATRVIASQLDTTELLSQVASIAGEALLVEHVNLYEWDDADRAFVRRSPSAAGGDGRLDVDETAAEVLLRGESLVQKRGDGSLSPRAARTMDDAGETIALWVPFQIKGEICGAMRLATCARQREFAEGELRFALALGEHAAIALNNARLYARIEDQATKDGLTGLVNHRHFYERLAVALDGARSSETPLSLVMLDIDDFKRLNDTYGHPAGDEALRLVGGLLQAELRAGDIAARYGGEEFCVLLAGEPSPNGAADVRVDARDGEVAAGEAGADCGRDVAAAVAERLRQRIAACRFPIGPEGAAVRITVSLGVAISSGASEEVDQLVARADAALYAAKRAGKNRVEIR
jgi:GGDEF domain-containing protein